MHIQELEETLGLSHRVTNVIQNQLLRKAWTPGDDIESRKLTIDAIFLLLGQPSQKPNVILPTLGEIANLTMGGNLRQSYVPYIKSVTVESVFDCVLNFISNWELQKNGKNANQFSSLLFNAINLLIASEKPTNEEIEFKKLFEDVPDLQCLIKHVVDTLPLIFLYRTQNHFVDVFKYGVNIIFRSYSVLTTLSQKIKLNPALECLGFKSLKEFYTPLLLLFESLLQRHGFFDLQRLNISLDNDPQRFKEQKIKDLINNVIKHASFDRNFLKSQYQKMRTASSQENFISFNSFNPFLRKPLLKISKREFLCPDPQCLLAYAFWGLSSELRNKLKDEEKNKFDTEIGNALEEHFRQFGLQPAKPKDSDIKKETPSRADFFIKTERRTYIIEVKNSLGLRSPLFEPKELLKVWARTWHAYNQCMASQGSETAHFVIVVGETILLEATTFFLFAHHAKKMDLQKISLVSASLFESLICSKDLDKFVDLQKERAENFIKNPIYENLIKWIESEQDFVVANNEKLEEYYVPIRDELVPRRLSEFLENLSPEQENLS